MTENTYEAHLEPAVGIVGWEVHVHGVGVTQVEQIDQAADQAASLVSIMHPELDPATIRVEFVRA